MFILKDLRILRAIRFKSYLTRRVLKFLDIDDSFRYTEGFFEKILYRNANAWNLKRRINEDRTFGVKSQIKWILEKGE